MKKVIPLLLLVLLAFADQTAIAKKPNIVILFADDLDADEINVTSTMSETWPTPSGARKHLGKAKKAGDPKVYTPAIDSLAANGMLFTRFYVNATVCSSSRYCLLTGRYAFEGRSTLQQTPAGQHHTLGWEPDILRSEDSLPKRLQKLGYRTGIIGKWHNGDDGIEKLPKRNKNDHHAHATYEHTRKVQEKIRKRYDVQRNNLLDGYGWDVVDRMEWGNSIVNLDWQCDGALKFINESRDQPFFLYCALPVPHGQYSFNYNRDITQYDRRVTSYGVLEKTADTLPSDDDVLRRVKANGVRPYNAMATRMDDYIAAVLRKLDQLGLRENTIVLFTSDHGSRGKNSCYEGGAKVPLIISWPSKVTPGARNDSLIGSIDLTATFIELAGGNPSVPSAKYSRSFVPQLTGKAEPRGWRKQMVIEAGNSKAIVTRDWKYVANRVSEKIAEDMKARPREVFWTGVDHHNYSTENMYPDYWDADQLYDLNRDLYEQQNQAGTGKYRDQLRQLQSALAGYLKQAPHRFGEFNRND